MLDLPRFVLLSYSAEHDFWNVAATFATFDAAVDEYARLRGKGDDTLHLATLGFIAAPGTSMGTINKARSVLDSGPA